MSQTSIEVRDEIAYSLGKYWWLLLFGGVLSMVVGILAVTWPGKTAVVVAVLFAIYLIVSGIFEIIRGFSSGLSGGTRALFLITGALSVILGVFAIRSSTLDATELLGIFIGIAFLFRGFAGLFMAVDSKEGRGWNIFFGIVMLIGGVVVLVQPSLSLATLAWVVGIWLVVIGIYEVIASLMIRNRFKKFA